MQNEKKAYETPVITLVKFDASDRITASNCSGLQGAGVHNWCKEF